MSIQEQAVQMINDLSDENVIFLIDFMKRFMLPKEEDKNFDFRPYVIEAMEEARLISRNQETRKYSSFAEALEDMDIWNTN